MLKKLDVWCFEHWHLGTIFEEQIKDPWMIGISHDPFGLDESNYSAGVCGGSRWFFFCRCLCILENHAGELGKIKWHHFQKLTYACRIHFLDDGGLPYSIGSIACQYQQENTQRDYRWSSTNLNTSHLISPNHPAGPDIPPLWMVLGLSCWGCRMFCTIWLETPASPCWRLGWLSYQIGGLYNLSRWNLRWICCRRIGELLEKNNCRYTLYYICVCKTCFLDQVFLVGFGTKWSGKIAWINFWLTSRC